MIAQAPQLFSPMQGVYALLAQVVAGSFNQPTHKARKDQIVNTLRSTIAGHRSYLISEPQDLSDVWASIRRDPAAIDFLMDVTTQMLCALAGSPVPFPTLVDNLSAAFGCHKPNTGRNGQMVIDNDLMSRLPDPKASKDVLSANAWFVMLLLLSHRADLLE